MIDCYKDKIVFIRCCLATQAEKLRDKISLGKKCNQEFLRLSFYTTILNNLMNYNNCTEDNCLTETQADTLLNKLLYFCKNECGYVSTLTNQTIPEPQTPESLGGKIYN